jgi:pimeloyl-ACP methyl ester carboxylesterase
LLEPTAVSLNVRVIAPDRPGFGGSEFKRSRKLEDWPQDVIELADALDLDRFAILGFSGGGPYVAVCALKIRQRLSVAGIVSGLGPPDAPGVVDRRWRQNRQLLQLGRRAPWLVRMLSWLTAQAMKRAPDLVFDNSAAKLPEPDQVMLARIEYREYLRATVLEAFRPGTRGAALETALYARPWGFRLQDIKKEVYLWQGELDINVTPAMGRYLATAIPNCHARFYADEGHFSLLPNRMQEIIGTFIPA